MPYDGALNLGREALFAASGADGVFAGEQSPRHHCEYVQFDGKRCLGQGSLGSKLFNDQGRFEYAGKSNNTNDILATSLIRSLMPDV